MVVGATGAAEGAAQLAQGRDPAAIVGRMDRDGDGKLARGEFRGPASRFAALDGNGDGFVTVEEFAAAKSEGGGKHGSKDSRNPNAAWYETLPIILTHTHISPHIGVGQDRYQDWSGSVKGALREMDEHGVRAAIIMPTPKPWDRSTEDDFDQLVRIAGEHPDRFRVAGGGATINSRIEHTRPGSVDDGDRAALAERAAEIVAAGGVAFGETTALHFSFFSEHPFEETPADHPLFLHLADLAAKHDVPLDIHVEAVDGSWRVSSDLAARSNRNPDTVHDTVQALERLLAHNRKARIVWVHVGMDTTGHRTPAMTRRLLAAHPNLYLSITGFQSFAEDNWFMRPGKGLNPEWREVILAFPDRFLIGSDTFFQPDNPTRRMPQNVAPAVKIVRLPVLPPEVARKVAFENAQRVFGLQLIRTEDVPLPVASSKLSPHSSSPVGVPAPAQATTSLPPASAEPVGPKGRTARQVIESNDSDGDGRLAKSEFNGSPKAFGRIDADGDGFLTASEFEGRWRVLKAR